jgi:hypothetical protein
MLTRGRAANHLYPQVVGDSDPHTLIRPETVTPRTPTELLEQILARDDTPTSATTLLRRLSDPAARLHDAVQRYTDGLHAAAEQILGPAIVDTLDSRAEQVVPDITNEPAWPTLRANLISLAAEAGLHPLVHLYEAAIGRDLSTAEDMAAVLNWRLPKPAHTPGQPPLPWLRGISQAINDHPHWRQYLVQRSQLIVELADDIRRHASHDGTQLLWATQGTFLNGALISEVAVWRAANGVDPYDRRATGPDQLEISSAEWQRHLERRIAHAGDYPTNSDFRTQEVGSTLQVRRDKDRHHWPRPSANNQRPGPPGPSR